MTKNRFEELTKELLEACKEEINESIEMDCYINDWQDLIDEDVVDRLNNLQEVAYSISNVEDSLEDGDFSLKDIENIYDFVYDKPFANGDEETEYVAILKGLIELD